MRSWVQFPAPQTSKYFSAYTCISLCLYLSVCLTLCVCVCVWCICVSSGVHMSQNTCGDQRTPLAVSPCPPPCLRQAPFVTCLCICIAGRKAPWESPASTSTVGLRLQTHATVSSFYVGPHACVASVCLLSHLPSPNPVLSQSLERYHFLTSHCSLFL